MVDAPRLIGRPSTAGRVSGVAQEEDGVPVGADGLLDDLSLPLPIGAGYFPELYHIKVWGPVNVGILFALSEFIVAWGLAYYYAKRASEEFDPMAAAIVAEAEKAMGGKK